jgi:hypothetical protein
MCHVSRLTDDQQQTLAGMPLAYRRALERHIEEAPDNRPDTQRMFNTWAERMEALDKARTGVMKIDEVTREVIAEANETYRREQRLAYRR